MQYTAAQASIMRSESISEDNQQKHIRTTNSFRAADPLIGTKFQNPHLKAKCGFEIQVQNLKISNAITKRENPNLDSELDAKIMIN